MWKYLAIIYFFILPLNQMKPKIFLSFNKDIYQIYNSSYLLKQVQQCTGNKFGLYVPYDSVKFFWSGFGVVNSARVATEIARHIAEKEGKKGITLELLLEMEENSHIKPCEWSQPIPPECQQFWQDLSCEYATLTEGEVRVILGPKLNPNGIWLKTEQNQLEYRRNNGHNLWGFEEYELEKIYCKDMATHNSQIPEIKNQICMNKL